MVLLKIKHPLTIFIIRTTVFWFLLLVTFNKVQAEEVYVYKDKDAPENIFTFLMLGGDSQRLKIDADFNVIFKKGISSIKISYYPHTSDKNGWVRLSWQKTGSYNLTGARKLSFFARGENGGEVVEFELGSLSSAHLDSDSAASGPVMLTKDWQEYKIILFGLDLSRITNGFSCVINRFDNREGIVFYLDEIKFEREVK